ncbi:MAG: tetratricopeptide repeat protein [Burkholderiales bacterium]|nr:tetratricopeptide repeat protein [Burkholderiales bacterium]
MDALAQLEKMEGYLAQDPGNFELLARVIDLALEAQQWQRALTHTEAAVKQFPDDPYMRYRRGHALFALQQYAEAEAAFASVDDHNINLSISLAIAQQAQGKHQETVDTLLPWEDAPDLPAHGLLALLRSMHHVAQLEEAMAIFHTHQARMMQEASVLSAVSLILLDLNQIEEAGRMSEAALALGPRPLEALLTSGTLALGFATPDIAVELFNEVLTLQPKEGRSWAGLGMASMLKRDMHGAIAQLEKAAQYLPTHIGTLHTLAWCKIFIGDIAGAGQVFEQALALDRNFGESHGGIAVVAALRGEREVAQAAIERALRLDRQGLAARYAEMVLSGVTADPERFRALAFRIMSKHPSSFGNNLAEVVQRFDVH